MNKAVDYVVVNTYDSDNKIGLAWARDGKRDAIALTLEQARRLVGALELCISRVTKERPSGVGLRDNY